MNNSSILTVTENLNLTQSGAGIKSQITINNFARLAVLDDINMKANAVNKVEIELNNNTSLALAKNIERGVPAYGILDSNDFSTVILQAQSICKSFLLRLEKELIHSLLCT